MLTTALELPDCFYSSQPVTLITPSDPTPKHSLYLSNLDDQKFLRFSIRYLYLYRNSINTDILKSSLSRVLVEYYPLAGRLRTIPEKDNKLEVECNGEGALFYEAFMDLTADQFLQFSEKPNISWRKLLFRVDKSFLDIPPLVLQVTNLRCGGMILCMAINHCLCDGIGTSQFLHAWAHFTTKPASDLPISPFHCRHVLESQNPSNTQVIKHRGYTKTTPDPRLDLNINQYLQSVPLVPVSLTFTPSHILHLKKQCVPYLKCTSSFEVIASHTWRCWVKSLDLPPSLNVKLLFSINIRKRLNPEIPEGYYGNGFVLGCASATVKELVTPASLHSVVKLVQQAKSAITDDSARFLINLLEDKTVGTDVANSLLISQWSKLGLEDLDFGEGKPLHMGPLTSNIYCLFLPVVGDLDAVRVLMSMPESTVHKFVYYMAEVSERGDAIISSGHTEVTEQIGVI